MIEDRKLKHRTTQSIELSKYTNKIVIVLILFTPAKAPEYNFKNSVIHFLLNEPTTSLEYVIRTRIKSY